MESYNNIEPDEKWKLNKEKQGFSEPEIMIQKIKKIGKNKKMKNYKNIELFENIHDPTEPVSDNNIIEGLSSDGIAHFNESDYIGGTDDIYEGGNVGHNSSRSNNSIIDFINSIFDKGSDFTYFISYKITKTLSNKKDYNHNDVYVIQKYVGWFFSILISCYVVYNWAFIMFYKDEGNNSVELPEFLTRDYFNNQEFLNPVYRLANFFVHFSLFFPEKLQQGIQLTSSFLPKVLNSTICFSFLFFFLIFAFYHSTDTVREFFISVAKFDFSNPILSLMYVIIVFLLALAFIEPDYNPFNIISKINPITSMISMVITILRYAFVIFFGVPIAAILCIIYLFVYSFFGIILLSGFDFKRTFKTFSKINEYCKKTKHEIRKETPCEPYTFFEKIMVYINIGFDFVQG